MVSSLDRTRIEEDDYSTRTRHHILFSNHYYTEPHKDPITKIVDLVQENMYRELEDTLSSDDHAKKVWGKQYEDKQSHSLLQDKRMTRAIWNSLYVKFQELREKAGENESETNTWIKIYNDPPPELSWLDTTSPENAIYWQQLSPEKLLSKEERLEKFFGSFGYTVSDSESTKVSSKLGLQNAAARYFTTRYLGFWQFSKRNQLYRQAGINKDARRELRKERIEHYNKRMMVHVKRNLRPSRKYDSIPRLFTWQRFRYGNVNLTEEVNKRVTDPTFHNYKRSFVDVPELKTGRRGKRKAIRLYIESLWSKPDMYYNAKKPSQLLR